MESFSERLAGVQRRIEQACGRVGRDAREVRLVAVAKKFGPDAVREATEAGVRVIGENRVQEARQKIPLCPESLEWHMVGHVQRNKVKIAVRLFDMIHSVDSVRLLEGLEEACGEAGRTTPVCLEVNVSGEGSKYGVRPDDIGSLLDCAAGLKNVDVVGLMTIPPFASEPEKARPYFAELRELRGELQDSRGIALPELSMGMSNDFEIAVEEGATMIRIGTLLFGERKI